MTPLRSRILIVDDHALVRDMLSQRLAQEPDLEVVGTARDASQALDLTRQLRPDLVILDIDMPGLSAFDVAQRIREESPQTGLFFLSGYMQNGYIAQALQVRARGYATKGGTPESLLVCIRKILKGGTCFSPEVRSRLEFTAEGPRLAEGARTRAQLLTPRELEILSYLAKGLAKKEIARITDLSVKTVEQHCTHLMQKLDIHDRVELARFAIREGLVQP
jgi:DNA-binding NarL/FixJ family response regulator